MTARMMFARAVADKSKGAGVGEGKSHIQDKVRG